MQKGHTQNFFKLICVRVFVFLVPDCGLLLICHHEYIHLPNKPIIPLPTLCLFPRQYLSQTLFQLYEKLLQIAPTLVKGRVLYLKNSNNFPTPKIFCKYHIFTLLISSFTSSDNVLMWLALIAVFYRPVSKIFPLYKGVQEDAHEYLR